ncbi:MAG: hypothetical protein P1V36_09475 [Planctomycetota bacterium]|nr:hypothetical protein [Planctomycetota bacterium]
MRRSTRAAGLDGIARCGSLLVIALVVALPLAMACCPADMLGGSDGASGVGAGTGDEVAAALTSLDRDLHGARILPAPARNDLACAAALGTSALATSIAFLHSFDALAPPPRLGSRADTPGDARPGPTDLGHPLLS